MIRLIGGLPGSGKSYYAANFISKYGEYDQLYKTFVITKDVEIFTNLDDLQIKHQSLDGEGGCFDLYGGPSGFFTIENFKRIRKSWPKSHLLVIIDEAQRIIDDDLLKNKDVAFFFQYHRHLGIDIFLLTNDIASCSKKVVGLCEFLVEAQPRSKGLPGVFRYKFKDTKGNFLYSQSVRLKQEVFGIYKSFTTDETEKPKNVILHWLIMLFVVLILGVIGFKFFVNGFMHKKPKVASVSSKVVSDAPFKNHSSVRSLPSPPPLSPPVLPVRHLKRLSRVAPQRVLPPPSPVVKLPALAPVVTPSVVYPDGFALAKVTGVVISGEHKWFSLSGRLVPASDCHKYNELTGQAVCPVVATDD